MRRHQKQGEAAASTRRATITERYDAKLTGSGGARARVASVALLALATVQPAPSVASSEASPDPSPGHARVSFADGRLSIQARDAAWEPLIRELSRAIGIPVRVDGHPEAPRASAGTACAIDCALGALFGPRADFVFVYDSPNHRGRASRPEEIRVYVGLNRQREGRPAGPVVGLSPLDADRDAAAIVSAISTLDHRAERADLTVLVQYLGDPDPHIRQSALDAVVGIARQQPEVRTVLLQLINSLGDQDVRRVAADAVTGGAERDGGLSSRQPGPGG